MVVYINSRGPRACKPFPNVQTNMVLRKQVFNDIETSAVLIGKNVVWRVWTNRCFAWEALSWLMKSIFCLWQAASCLVMHGKQRCSFNLVSSKKTTNGCAKAATLVLESTCCLAQDWAIFLVFDHPIYFPSKSFSPSLCFELCIASMFLRDDQGKHERCLSRLGVMSRDPWTFNHELIQ